MTHFKVAVAGLGTVGSSVVRMLQENASYVERTCGTSVEVVAVSARSKDKDRGFSMDGIDWYDDPVEMVSASGADLVVELIGGEEGLAKQIVETALVSGTHVVTANKALMAVHGISLSQLSEKHGAALKWDAGVGGAIPLIKTFIESLAVNEISKVYGILNGTCNYILTTIAEERLSFDDVLQDAMAKGYAEADPSFDIDGIDTAHKLSLLSSVAFGHGVDFENIYIEGIRHIEPIDFEYADHLGYNMKMLGMAFKTVEGVAQKVFPCFLPNVHPLASVNGVTNAVVVEGSHFDRLVFSGPGAGGDQTASAVVNDIADIVRGSQSFVFGVKNEQLTDLVPVSMDSHYGAYYIRLKVKDVPGVIGAISSTIGQTDVSIDAVISRNTDHTDTGTRVVFTTQETTEDKISVLLDKLRGLDVVLSEPLMIRIHK